MGPLYSSCLLHVVSETRQMSTETSNNCIPTVNYARCSTTYLLVSQLTCVQYNVGQKSNETMTNQYAQSKISALTIPQKLRQRQHPGVAFVYQHNTKLKARCLCRNEFYDEGCMFIVKKTSASKTANEAPNHKDLKKYVSIAMHSLQLSEHYSVTTSLNVVTRKQ